MTAANVSAMRGNKWLTLVSVSFGLIIVGLNGTVVAIALPSISRALHASLSDLQWVTSAYLLVVTVCLIASGKLGDRFGRRRIYMIGIAGFAATSLACGQVDSVRALIALRGVQGLFGSLLLPQTLAILRATFPPEQLKTAVGIWGGASAFAVSAGPIIGGFLVEHSSWRAVFYINVPVALLGLALGFGVINESRDPEVTRPDPTGTIALAGGLFLLVFGLIKSESWGWGNDRTLAFLIAGALLLAFFVIVESRVSEPLLPLEATVAPAMLIVGLGLLSFTSVNPRSGYGALWPGFVAIGLGFGIVVATTSDEIIEAAPVREAGIAGGINSTSQQLGAVIGTSLLGSLLAGRAAGTFVRHLTSSGLPAGAARALGANPEVKSVVGQGIAPRIPGAPARALLATSHGSHDAFCSGLSLAMLVSACACFGGGAIALIFLSSRRASEALPRGQGLSAIESGSVARLSGGPSTSCRIENNHRHTPGNGPRPAGREGLTTTPTRSHTGDADSQRLQDAQRSAPDG